MIENPHDVLGFYFMVFQSNLNDYVRCWIDGSEDWSYFEKKELFIFAKSIDCRMETIQKMDRCLDTTSIYIWNVEAEEIVPLRAYSDSGESLMEEVSKMRNEAMKFKKSNIEDSSIGFSFNPNDDSFTFSKY